MKIIVKRFCLAHNGEIYKAGDVVEIADPHTAKRLVARSGGTLDVYHGHDDVEDVPDEDSPDAADDGAAGDMSKLDSDEGAGGIPAFDPAAAVQTGDKTKGKDKGRKK